MWCTHVVEVEACLLPERHQCQCHTGEHLQWMTCQVNTWICLGTQYRWDLLRSDPESRTKRLPYLPLYFMRSDMCQPTKIPGFVLASEGPSQKQWKSKVWTSFLCFSSKMMIFLIVLWWFLKERKSSKTLRNHQKIIKKSSFCLKKSRKLAKNNENSRFWQVFLNFFLAKWWFFDDFLIIFEERKSSKTLGNHQKIILLLEKNKENLPKPWVFIVFGKCSWFFSSKMMIFWWFFNDFLEFCLIFSPSKIIKKSSKNHPFGRKKQRKPTKTLSFHCFWQVFLIFSSKMMIFWWFPRVLLHFLSFKNHQKIIQKSSFC